MRLLQRTLVLILALGPLFFWPPQTFRAGAVTVSCPSPSSASAIQAAIDSSSPGSTVFVQPCSYLGTLVVWKALHLLGASPSTTIIDGQGLGTVIAVKSSNVEIRGFTVQHSNDSGWGIRVDGALGVNITGNVVAAGVNSYGVSLFKANNTLVRGNTFSSNLYAVDVSNSESVKITGNRMVQADTAGLQMLFTRKSLVFNNTFAGGQDGVGLVESSGNNVTRNLFRDASFYALGFFVNSPHTPPSGFPQNNTVSENTFQRNHIGIDLQNATYNTFYRNDFFLSGYRHANPVQPTASFAEINSPNSWNVTLGSVHAGNYWDNYNGTDPDGDGIGDTPYVIAGSNRDYYPFMRPFLPVPVIIRQILVSPASGSAPLTVALSAVLDGTLTPFSYGWVLGDGSPVVTSASVTHTFVQPGNYSVAFTVVDSSGVSDSLSTAVTVVAGASSLPLPVPGVLAGLVVVGVAGFLWYRRRRNRAAKKR